jgi:hypothetical protein
MDNILGGLWLGLELKKKITESQVSQVITQLLVANYYANQPAMMVLTDLGSKWRFYWMVPGLKIVECELDLPGAINAIETVLSESSTDTLTSSTDTLTSSTDTLTSSTATTYIHPDYFCQSMPA